MKHTKKILTAIFAASVLLAVVLSAGCVSLGSQTTDILMGNEKVGTVTITPNQSDMFSSDKSLTEKFNAEIELFGIKYTKEGLTRTESDDLVALLSSGHPGLNISDFVSGFSSKKPEVSNDDFFDKLINMPMSAENNATFAESLNLSGVGDNIESAVNQFEKIFGGLI
ncbi:MAG TPA: hypothetical protein O0X97_02195 [Methanocorpusculum sp.]|nr:hypothetical protein [Methanocorpusculum sp.]